jgi:hypothetical protein
MTSNLGCLLPTAYCLLPTAYCLLPTAYCLLPTAFSELSLGRAGKNVRVDCLGIAEYYKPNIAHVFL